MNFCKNKLSLLYFTACVYQNSARKIKFNLYEIVIKSTQNIRIIENNFLLRSKIYDVDVIYTCCQKRFFKL